MPRMTRPEVEAILGPANDHLIAHVMAMDISPDELAEVRAWAENDEAMANEGRRMPSGPAADLIDMLRAGLDPADAAGP